MEIPSFLPLNFTTDTCFAGFKVAGFVKDIVGWQQGFMLGEDHLPRWISRAELYNRREVFSTIRSAPQLDNPSVCILARQLGNVLDRLLDLLQEPVLLQQVAGRIAGQEQLGKYLIISGFCLALGFKGRIRDLLARLPSMSPTTGFIGKWLFSPWVCKPLVSKTLASLR